MVSSSSCVIISFPPSSLDDAFVSPFVSVSLCRDLSPSRSLPRLSRSHSFGVYDLLTIYNPIRRSWSMNFTLDDTASQLSFSSGWASQSPSDPDLSQFFEGTYHAAQSTGATLNMSVQGTGIYIYGSKGPNHVSI